MSLKRCVLKGEEIRSLEDVYDQMSGQLPFPQHFGRNLDALYDVLSVDMEGPIELVWENPESSRAAMGNDFEKIAGLLMDVEEERDDFLVTLR